MFLKGGFGEGSYSSLFRFILKKIKILFPFIPFDTLMLLLERKKVLMVKITKFLSWILHMFPRKSQTLRLHQLHLWVYPWTKFILSLLYMGTLEYIFPNP